MIFWFTGQPGAGKTTLAIELMKHLEKSIHIDGDNLREIFKNFDYTSKGRQENIKNVITIARFLDHMEYNIIISVVAPFRELRESLKKTNKVTEIYVHTNKIRGREHYFSKNYEKPLNNYIDMDTSTLSPSECIKMLLDKL